MKKILDLIKDVPENTVSMDLVFESYCRDNFLVGAYYVGANGISKDIGSWDEAQELAYDYVNSKYDLDKFKDRPAGRLSINVKTKKIRIEPHTLLWDWIIFKRYFEKG